MKIIRTAKLKRILSQTKEWNTNGSYSIEVSLLSPNGDPDPNGNVYDVTHSLENDPTLQHLKPYLQKIPESGYYGELVIEFSSKGSHTNKSMYGGNDRVGWPEESDEGRVYLDSYIKSNNQKISIDKNIGESLFERFKNSIDEVSIDTDETGYNPGY